MAQNINALLRYRTIDRCLQDQSRTWTLDGLIEACSAALQEYEGVQVKVSKRTVQLDIQMLRSDELGYSAPIEVYERKYYKYADPDFSITNVPLTVSDMGMLQETVELLKQFKDFTFYSELDAAVQELDDKVNSKQSKVANVSELKEDGDAVKVVLNFDKNSAEIVASKPIHRTQKISKKLKNGGVVVKLKVPHDLDFERLVLSFGESVEVVEPKSLRKSLKKRYKKAFQMYQSKKS